MLVVLVLVARGRIPVPLTGGLVVVVVLVVLLLVRCRKKPVPLTGGLGVVIVLAVVILVTRGRTDGYKH